jgi:hypothetical protein
MNYSTIDYKRKIFQADASFISGETEVCDDAARSKSMQPETAVVDDADRNVLTAETQVRVP